MPAASSLTAWLVFPAVQCPGGFQAEEHCRGWLAVRHEGPKGQGREQEESSAWPGVVRPPRARGGAVVVPGGQAGERWPHGHFGYPQGAGTVPSGSTMVLTPSGRYDPDHVCNASDNAGRYTYRKQPEVCKWNLRKLAEALEPELPLALAEAILAEEYDAEFCRHYLHKMRSKLGLVQTEQEEDAALVARLLETMQLTGECGQPHGLRVFTAVK